MRKLQNRKPYPSQTEKVLATIFKIYVELHIRYSTLKPFTEIIGMSIVYKC